MFVTAQLTLFASMDYLQGRLISSIETQHWHQEWLAFLKKINRETPKTLQLHLIVDIEYMDERFFRDISVYLRDGSFSSARELASSITTFLALPNAQPCHYVWRAKR